MQKSEIKEKKRFWISVGLGALFILVLVLITLAVTSALISSEKISESSSVTIIQTSTFICAIIGAFLARSMNSGKGAFPTAMASASLAAAVRLLVSAAETNSRLLSASDLTITACILCGGLMAAALGVKKKPRRRR